MKAAARFHNCGYKCAQTAPADGLYSDAKRRQKKAASVAASRVSEECSVNSRWRTKKAASDVEAGFDRLFDDSVRWQKKNKVLPPRPVTGTVKYKIGSGPILEPAPKLPEDERLSRLLKQYYKHNPIRTKNRKKLFNTYCAGLSAEEQKLLGILDEPEMPSEDKLQELAEKELAEMVRLCRLVTLFLVRILGKRCGFFFFFFFLVDWVWICQKVFFLILISRKSGGPATIAPS